MSPITGISDEKTLHMWLVFAPLVNAVMRRICLNLLDEVPWFVEMMALY